MGNHFAHPVNRLLHFALEEIIHSQLIAQVLLRLAHLRCRTVNRIERSDGSRIVLTLHQGIAQQLINLAFVLGVGILLQEVIERAHGLAQCTGRLVGTERIVICCLFGDGRSNLIVRSSLVGQFGLFGLTELAVGVTHRQTSGLGQRIGFLLHLLERVNRRLVVTQPVLRHAEQEEVIANQFLFVRQRRLTVTVKMVHR